MSSQSAPHLTTHTEKDKEKDKDKDSSNNSSGSNSAQEKASGDNGAPRTTPPVTGMFIVALFFVNILITYYQFMCNNICTAEGTI